VTSRVAGQLEDLCHLRIIDLLGGVARMVVIGVEPGEPPERRYVVQHERKPVRAKHHVQRVLVIEAIIQHQAHLGVGLGDHALIIRAVRGADQVEPVAGIGGDRDEPFGLRTGLLVAPDHIEVDHGAGGLERTQRIRSEIVAGNPQRPVHQHVRIGGSAQRCHRTSGSACSAGPAGCSAHRIGGRFTFRRSSPVLDEARGYLLRLVRFLPIVVS